MCAKGRNEMKNWTKQDQEALVALMARKQDLLQRFENACNSLACEAYPNSVTCADHVALFLRKHGQATLDMLRDYFEPSPRAVPESNEYGARDKFIPGLPVQTEQQLAKR